MNHQQTLADAPGRARPAVLRALGHNDPPAEVTVDGKRYRLAKIFKHDSWAATAMYQGDDGAIVCKFNRCQPIFILPAGWLGRVLARRESKAYALLADVPNVPAGLGPVSVDGRIQRNVAAHRFLPGTPMHADLQLDDDFFPALRGLLEELHRRGMAYVDLHKFENVIVGDDGRPYLIDFQISVRLPRIWPLTWVQSMCQQSDIYHFHKHFARLRPDQSDVSLSDIDQIRPWWLRVHRMFGVPARTLRRWLLVKIGVRRESGRASTEAFPEEAFQRDKKAA